MITWTDDYDHCYECTGYGDDYYFDEESRMSDLISRKALCEYALNQKDKSITPNDIMRFPSAQPKKRTENTQKTHACDLISRQAAIEAVEHITSSMSVCVNTDECHGMKRMQRQAVIELANLPSAQPERRWIPCSEELPEEKDAGILKKLGTSKRSEYVLATVEVKGERMTVTACTYDGKWYWNMKYAFQDYKIVAWMPLPEPYAERRTDGSD